MQPGFDTSDWMRGEAPLGYGDGEAFATSLDYGPEATNKHPTAYFRAHFTVTDPADIVRLKALARFDDGMVVYVNGQEVARANMPAGPVGYTNWATASGVNPPRHWQSFVLPAAALVEGVNTLAVEVHQVGPGSSDLFFDMVLQPENAIVLHHTPTGPVVGTAAPWTIPATVGTSAELASLVLYWREHGAATWTAQAFSGAAGNYSATLAPASVVDHA